MSKYQKLWDYIKTSNKSQIVLSFEEIKDICGIEIDHSFLNYKKELKEFNYQVAKISLKDKKITFSQIKLKD